MPHKVVFLHGSPRRRGNTRALATLAMAELAKRGIAADEIDVPGLAYTHPGCIACFKCQQSPGYGCHVGDGLAEAVARLPGYDALVMATPVYWFSAPAQMKMLIDRMFSLIKFGPGDAIASPLRGKVLALFATGGGEEEENLDILAKQWRIPAERLGMPFLSCLFPFCHFPPGEAAADPESAQQARDFAGNLAGLLAAAPAGR
ncbi:NAD(P)H-dependent oxidoreductase [Solidesulfovibrio sp.]|uniref:flavodoxin family protein n=1 Tax=Solidesulfovibrio sp. TaxID=2910990 RepID=UPI002B209F91|nr:NAD(P)H-dependent oxidoreductase [Solidesulfovibrio sp.]MEA4858583.1 NAD(P)H-dependent oxidoreductase [Solidesulfovibrio sp.]